MTRIHLALNDKVRAFANLEFYAKEIDPSDSIAEQHRKYNADLRFAIDIAEHQAARDLKKKSHSDRKARVGSVQSGSTRLPLDQTLCYGFARNGRCGLGKKCRRQHMPADAYRNGPFYAALPAKMRQAVDEIAVASVSNPVAVNSWKATPPSAASVSTGAGAALPSGQTMQGADSRLCYGGGRSALRAA